MSEWTEFASPFCARMKYAFDGGGQHHLSLERNEEVVVLAHSGGWYHGASTRNLHIRGIFPTAYTDTSAILDADAEPDAGADAPAARRGRASLSLQLDALVSDEEDGAAQASAVDREISHRRSSARAAGSGAERDSHASNLSSDRRGSVSPRSGTGSSGSCSPSGRSGPLRDALGFKVDMESYDEEHADEQFWSIQQQRRIWRSLLGNAEHHKQVQQDLQQEQPQQQQQQQHEQQQQQQQQQQHQQQSQQQQLQEALHQQAQPRSSTSAEEQQEPEQQGFQAPHHEQAQHPSPPQPPHEAPAVSALPPPAASPDPAALPFEDSICQRWKYTASDQWGNANSSGGSPRSQTLSTLKQSIHGRFERVRRGAFTRAVRGGVPPELRARVWWHCSGAGEKKSRAAALYSAGGGSREANEGIWEAPYEALVMEMSAGRCGGFAQTIEKDLTRTFPENAKFDEAAGLDCMRRVLVAYSLRNPEVGYCQSMNFLCAILLLHFEEESFAFWTLAALIEDMLPKAYYESTMLGSRADQAVLQACLRWKLPRAWSRCEALGVPIEPITCSWFLCLFVNTLPLALVLRVWDAFFHEGSKTLFRVSLALFKLRERDLIAARDFQAAYDVLRSPAARGASAKASEMIDADELLKAAHDRSLTISYRQLNAMRAKHRGPLEVLLREAERSRREIEKESEEAFRRFREQQEQKRDREARTASSASSGGSSSSSSDGSNRNRGESINRNESESRSRTGSESRGRNGSESRGRNRSDSRSRNRSESGRNSTTTADKHDRNSSTQPNNPARTPPVEESACPPRRTAGAVPRNSSPGSLAGCSAAAGDESDAVRHLLPSAATAAGSARRRAAAKNRRASLMHVVRGAADVLAFYDASGRVDMRKRSRSGGAAEAPLPSMYEAGGADALPSPPPVPADAAMGAA